MIRRQNESENLGINLYDTVNCAGYSWHVIDIEDDIATLLAIDDVFGHLIFDYKSNGYRNSYSREYIASTVLPRLSNSNPIPAKLNDVGCTDKAWLLSVDEAEKLPINIKRFPHWYWLRSSGGDNFYAASVHHNGDFYAIGLCVPGISGSIRPTIKVHISNLL